MKAASEGVQLVVDAGALATRVAKVDERHLISVGEIIASAEA